MPILPLLLLTVAPVGSPSTVATNGTWDIGCQMPAGWDEVERSRPRYVVFGEQHGTREAPLFVAEVVCALVTRGERVLLAIEHYATDDEALRKAWELPDDRFREALLQTAWTSTDDGRDSEAMFGMLVRLHHLKSHGAPLSVTAFTGMRDEAQERRWAHLPAQGPHEAAQAENIRLAASHGHYDRVIVLVGNFHASRSSVGPGGERFDSMATHLARSETTISLELRSSGGTAWNCATKPGVHFEIGKPVPPDAIECADHAYRNGLDLHHTPFMHLGPFPGDEITSGYDGFFWLGRTSGSAPKQKP